MRCKCANATPVEVDLTSRQYSQVSGKPCIDEIDETGVETVIKNELELGPEYVAIELLEQPTCFVYLPSAMARSMTGIHSQLLKNPR